MIIFTTFCAIFLISCNCEENLTTTTELIDTSTTLIEDTVISTVISDNITTTIENTDTTTVFSDDITTTIVDTVITTEVDDINTGNLVLLCHEKKWNLCHFHFILHVAWVESQCCINKGQAIQ